MLLDAQQKKQETPSLSSPFPVQCVVVAFVLFQNQKMRKNISKLLIPVLETPTSCIDQTRANVIKRGKEGRGVYGMRGGWVI